MILSRRKLIGALGLVVAAPAIVRAGSIMPVKARQGVLTVADWEFVSAHILAIEGGLMYGIEPYSGIQYAGLG